MPGMGLGMHLTEGDGVPPFSLPHPSKGGGGGHKVTAAAKNRFGTCLNRNAHFPRLVTGPWPALMRAAKHVLLHPPRNAVPRHTQSPPEGDTTGSLGPPTTLSAVVLTKWPNNCTTCMSAHPTRPKQAPQSWDLPKFLLLKCAKFETIFDPPKGGGVVILISITPPPKNNALGDTFVGQNTNFTTG